MDKRFVGLYRDDGLGVLYSGPASERKRKELIKVFKQYNLYNNRNEHSNCKSTPLSIY